MKKLKIFLLLSILLCLGLFLNNNILASSVGGEEVKTYTSGPKKFEVGDVLPAGQIKISWDFSERDIFGYTEFLIEGSPDFFLYIEGYDFEDTPNFRIFLSSVFLFSDLVGNTTITLENDVTITELKDDANKSYLEYVDGAIFWEDLNAPTEPTEPTGPKIFEVGDVLPQGKIRISWDETTWYKMHDLFVYHQIKSDNNNFNFMEKIETNYYICGIPIMFIPEPGNLEFYPPYTVYGEGHSYVDVNTSGWDLAKRTISTVIWDDYFQIIARLYWEDITPDGYTQGYLEARDEFAYYDSRTGEWISVSEYLDRYGTDKPGQSDFYANFDKYFIPAMIIVFGGAIVLTILKVFKGRE